jgi:opacity protein-like surface antigen
MFKSMTRTLALVGAAVMVSAGVARAQAIGSWTPFVGGTLALPVGNLSNVSSFGFGAIGGAEYRFTKEFGLRPEVDFTYFSGKAGVSSLTSFGFGASGILHIEASGGFKPYALFRLGFNAGSASVNGGGSSSSTDLGFAPGFGGDFKCGGAPCFIEGKFYIVNTSGSSANSIMVTFGRRF